MMTDAARQKGPGTLGAAPGRPAGPFGDAEDPWPTPVLFPTGAPSPRVTDPSAMVFMPAPLPMPHTEVVETVIELVRKIDPDSDDDSQPARTPRRPRHRPRRSSNPTRMTL